MIFVVNDGERICQMVIKQYSHVEWEEAKELDRTKREGGGIRPHRSFLIDDAIPQLHSQSLNGSNIQNKLH